MEIGLKQTLETEHIIVLQEFFKIMMAVRKYRMFIYIVALLLKSRSNFFRKTKKVPYKKDTLGWF